MSDIPDLLKPHFHETCVYSRPADQAQDDGERKWYVMRDLRRKSKGLDGQKHRAWEIAIERGKEVFVPTKWVVTKRMGRTKRECVPALPDLVFVRDTRSGLDPIHNSGLGLTYRFVRGRAFCDPLTVSDADMQRFIDATLSQQPVSYYTPDELTQYNIGQSVRIVGGTLDGYEGKLLVVRGSKKRRLLIEIPGLITAGVEVSPEYIQIIN